MRADPDSNYPSALDVLLPLLLLLLLLHCCRSRLGSLPAWR
jgi:hypothetical protein